MDNCCTGSDNLRTPSTADFALAHLSHCNIGFTFCGLDNTTGDIDSYDLCSIDGEGMCPICMDQLEMDDLMHIYKDFESGDCQYSEHKELNALAITGYEEDNDIMEELYYYHIMVVNGPDEIQQAPSAHEAREIWDDMNNPYGVEANNPYSYEIKQVDPEVFHWLPVTMYYDIDPDCQS